MIEVEGIIKKTAAQKLAVIGFGNDGKRKDFLKKISNT